MEYLFGLTFDVKRSCQLCVRCHHSLELDICDTQHYQSVQGTWKELQTEKTTQNRREKVKHICKEGNHHLEEPRREEYIDYVGVLLVRLCMMSNTWH